MDKDREAAWVVNGQWLHSTDSGIIPPIMGGEEDRQREGCGQWSRSEGCDDKDSAGGITSICFGSISIQEHHKHSYDSLTVTP